MVQLSFKLSSEGQELALIFADVDVTPAFLTSITSALTEGSESTSSEYIAALLSHLGFACSTLQDLPCMMNGGGSCEFDYLPHHSVLALQPVTEGSTLDVAPTPVRKHLAEGSEKVSSTEFIKGGFRNPSGGLHPLDREGLPTSSVSFAFCQLSM